MPPLRSRDILMPWRADSFCSAATSAAVHKLLRITVPLPLGVSSDMLIRRGDRASDMEISRGRNEQQPVHLPGLRCRTVRTGSLKALTTEASTSAIAMSATKSATAITTILPCELLILRFPLVFLSLYLTRHARRNLTRPYIAIYRRAVSW